MGTYYGDMSDPLRRPPQTAEDTIALLTASLVLVRLAAYKTCSCCDRIFRTRDDFGALPLCGPGYQPQFTESGDVDPNVRLELRNCSCSTTLSVEVPTVPGACLECGDDTGLHAFTCDKRAATCCGEEHCVCGGAA